MNKSRDWVTLEINCTGLKFATVLVLSENFYCPWGLSFSWVQGEIFPEQGKGNMEDSVPYPTLMWRSTCLAFCTPLSGCLLYEKLMACYSYSDFSVSFYTNPSDWPHQIIISLLQATKSNHYSQVNGSMMQFGTFGTEFGLSSFLKNKSSVYSVTYSPKLFIHPSQNSVCKDIILISYTDIVICSCVVLSHFISQITLFLV